MSTATPSSLRIAIIGGGPGGLTLAQLLQLQGLRPTVYDLEESVNARSQGGSLDLHTDTGIPAMKSTGLWDDFLKYARYEDQTMRVLDKYGVVHLDESAEAQPQEGEDHSRPEIDR